MGYAFEHQRMPVTTSPAVVASFLPADLSSMVVKAEGTLYLGFGSVSTSNGFPLFIGDSLSFNFQDFSPALLASNERVNLYAVAAAATEISILMLRKWD